MTVFNICLSLWCRRRFGTKCSGCNIGMCPEDLVRKAINKVYHVHCFVCSVCRRQLDTGEQLYLVQVTTEEFLFIFCYLPAKDHVVNNLFDNKMTYVIMLFWLLISINLG